MGTRQTSGQFLDGIPAVTDITAKHDGCNGYISHVSGMSRRSLIAAFTVLPVAAYSDIFETASSDAFSRPSADVFARPQDDPEYQHKLSDEGPVISSLLEAATVSSDILRLVDQTSQRYASHPAISAAGFSLAGWTNYFRAMIEVESGFKIKAHSHAGAIGLAQLMPKTAKYLGVNPHNPAENLDGGVRYLLMQLSRFGTAELALAAYNAGPNAVLRYRGIPPYRETQSHVRKVMAIYHRHLA